MVEEWLRGAFSVDHYITHNMTHDRINMAFDLLNAGEAIWQRAPVPEFVDWIEVLPAVSLPRLRIVAPVESIGEVRAGGL